MVTYCVTKMIPTCSPVIGDDCSIILIKSGNNEPSKSTSWKVLETVLSHLKAVARVRSKIEEECHDWFEDTSRLAGKIGATVSVPRNTGRQEHRNNHDAPSVNQESHYGDVVAISLIDHLLEEINSRFREDNRAGAKSFSLVPSVFVI